MRLPGTELCLAQDQPICQKDDGWETCDKYLRSNYPSCGVSECAAADFRCTKTIMDGYKCQFSCRDSPAAGTAALLAPFAPTPAPTSDQCPNSGFLPRCDGGYGTCDQSKKDKYPSCDQHCSKLRCGCCVTVNSLLCSGRLYLLIKKLQGN